MKTNRIYIKYDDAVAAITDYLVMQDEMEHGRRKISKSLQKETAKFMLKGVHMYVSEEDRKDEPKANAGSADQDR